MQLGLKTDRWPFGRLTVESAFRFHSTVDVWVYDISSIDTRHDQQDCLSVKEINRADQFKLSVDRDRYIQRHVICRRLLSKYLAVSPTDIEFVYECQICGNDTHGKPRIGTSDLEFSLSHTQNFVALAIANLPIGIDIEVPPCDAGFLNTALSRCERQNLGPDTGSQALTAVWTRKEALLKATGEGLLCDPAEITVLPTDETIYRRDVTWQIETHMAADFIVSLASPKVETRIQELADGATPRPDVSSTDL